jgi:hypothetical protein
LPGLLTRAEINSYRPGLGLCDSLSRKQRETRPGTRRLATRRCRLHRSRQLRTSSRTVSTSGPPKSGARPSGSASRQLDRAGCHLRRGDALEPPVERQGGHRQTLDRPQLARKRLVELRRAQDRVWTGAGGDRQTWRIFCGGPAGPFEILDVIGMDTSNNILTGFGDERSKALADYLKERYIDRGKLAVGSGEGFYKYPAMAQAG